MPINNHELLNIQACSFRVFGNTRCTQSLMVSCKYWVVPMLSTRVSKSSSSDADEISRALSWYIIIRWHVVSEWWKARHWWRHPMETFSALLALCAGNSPVTGEFPSQRPSTRSLDVFFDLRTNERLSKQSRGWWFESPSCSLWRLCNDWTCTRLLYRIEKYTQRIYFLPENGLLNINSTRNKFSMVDYILHNACVDPKSSQ